MGDTGNLLSTILLFAAVLSAALGGTALMRRLGPRYGWLAPPRADRWHQRPVSLHGGVGFFPPFFLAALWVLVLQNPGFLADLISYRPLPSKGALMAALLLGALFMFLIGLWDDLRDLRPATKLLCQFLAVSFFAFQGGIFPVTQVPVVNLLATYLWFIGITNAVNMLDNMDGLAAGVVIIATEVMVLLTGQNTHWAFPLVPSVSLGLVLTAALLGFWFHNRPPAKIFMGDSGSLAIGFVLAALTVPSPINALVAGRSAGSVLGSVMVLLIPVTVLAIPIFDTTLVTVTRIWRSQKPSEGGRDHASHRLVGLGLSEPRAILFLYVLAAFGGGIALLMNRYPGQSLPLFGLFALVLVLSGVYLGHVKIKKIGRDRVPPAWTPLISDLLYKRHAAEIVLDTFLSILCFYAAHLLRFEGNLPDEIERAMIQALPLVVPSSLLSLFVAGIYRGQWRLLSVPDLPAFAFGVLGGTILSLATLTLFTRFTLAYSRSAFIIYGLLFFLALLGSRLSFRIFDVLSQKQFATARHKTRQTVLIYGAGKGGKLLYDEIMFNPHWSEYAVVGFLDDDPNRTGQNLCGLPVRNKSSWYKEWSGDPPEIWVSSRSIPDEKVQRAAQDWGKAVTIKRLKVKLEPLARPAHRLPADPPENQAALPKKP